MKLKEYYKSKNCEEPPPYPDLTDVTQDDIEKSKKLCYQHKEIASKAKNYKDFRTRECQTWADSHVFGVDDCYSLIAQEFNDVSFCQKIKDEFIRYDCLNEMAVQLQDEGLCREITTVNDDRDECLSKVAIIKKDPKICDQVSQGESGAGWVWGECYKGVAFVREDFLLCAYLKDPFTFKQLLKGCVEEIIIKKQDKVDCQEINDSKIQEICLDYFEGKK